MSTWNKDKTEGMLFGIAEMLRNGAHDSSALDTLHAAGITVAEINESSVEQSDKSILFALFK